MRPVIQEGELGLEETRKARLRQIPLNDLAVTGHNLDLLLLHMTITFGCVYSGPLTQAGALNLKWESWSYRVSMSYTVSLARRCFEQFTLRAHGERQSVYLLQAWTLQGRW